MYEWYTTMPTRKRYKALFLPVLFASFMVERYKPNFSSRR